MTKLLERYLAEVRDALPAGVDVDDILAEIADAVESKVEEGVDESAAIGAFGDPRVVASRYRRVQYLIGPAIFPYYLSTLRNVVIGGIAIELLGGGIAAIVMKNGNLFESALTAVWQSVPWMALVVTALFAIYERGDSFTVPRATRRPQALIEFIANMAMLLVTLDSRALFANIGLTFAPSWFGIYLGTALATALLAGSALLVFVWPRYERLHEVVRIVSSVITSGGIIYTLASGPLFESASPGVNTAAMVTLAVALVIMIVNAWRCVRSLTKQRDFGFHAL